MTPLLAPLLAVEQLCVRRGGRDVLTNVSFTARPAEILGVIGPNGAGKTTLFEAIAGLLPIASGTVRHEPMFYVPDAIRPWPEQSVRWTLRLHARMFGAHVDDALVRALALDALLDAKVRTLSKGEAKRLGVALALLTPRPLLLIDEPFDGLDLRQTLRAIEVLRGVVRDGRTLVLSIHQLADAARVCDRFLLLDSGRSIAEGTETELGGSLEEVFLALP